MGYIAFAGKLEIPSVPSFEITTSLVSVNDGIIIYFLVALQLPLLIIIRIFIVLSFREIFYSFQYLIIT